MATSSIKKNFVVKSDKACNKLIREYKKKPHSVLNCTKSYEEGKKKLEQYFGR